MRPTLSPTLAACCAACLAVAVSLPSLGAGLLQLTLIPTRIEQPDELRINTGRKATLADGSYNTVYDKKRPKADHVFLEIRFDVAIENGSLALSPDNLLLTGIKGGEALRYHPVDWFRDLGLSEQRGDSLMVRSAGSFDVSFEVPRTQADALSFWVGGLRVGSIPELVAFTEGRRE